MIVQTKALRAAINTSIDEQSPDIALGVDHSKENKSGPATEEDLHGIGDQGMIICLRRNSGVDAVADFTRT